MMKKVSSLSLPGSTSLKMVYVSCPACGAREGDVIAEGVDFEYHVTDDVFHMVQCKECGVIYLNPRPAIEELGRIYPLSYVPYHFAEALNGLTGTARNFLLKRRAVAFRRLVGNEARILEVGCGNGAFLLLMRRFGSSGWELAGVDIDDVARQPLERNNITFHHGRFEDLSFAADSWDLIVMKDVIEHLDNPAAVLEKARHVLKPSGLLLLETPNYQGWDAKIFRSSYWGGWHFPRHWTIYHPQSLRSHLHRSGFELISIKPLLSPNFWAQSFHHWLAESKRVSFLAKWFDCRYFLPMAFFGAVDLFQVTLFNSSSNMRVLACKPVSLSEQS